MRKIFCLAITLITSLTLCGQSGFIKYSVPNDPWSEYFGNHRTIIKVDKPSDAVLIDFLWRRHDSAPEKRRMLIIKAKSGKEVNNIFRVSIDNDRCNLVFGPVDTAGLYYFYYLPCTPPVTGLTGRGRPARQYAPPENAPDSLWVLKHLLSEGPLKYKGVSKATVTDIQARNEFDSFYPMEVVATGDETRSYLNLHRDEYLVFAEDRAFPIRMLDALPLRWMQRSPGVDFSGKAMKNEYYALQLGVFASQCPIQNIKLEFSDLTDKNGHLISRKAFTCFNTDRVNIDGNPFKIRVDVKQGRIQPLWVGIEIPPDVAAGIYEGAIVVKPENLKEQKVKVILTIDNDYLADRGDGETWRYSRLRWLNSTLGIDDEPVAPYKRMAVDDRKISCLGRSVQLNSYGIPEVINSWGNSILASSMKIIIQVDDF